MYFRQKMIESKKFQDIGSWWQVKKEEEPCEIDIVGIYTEGQKALVAEVKRQRKNFKPEEFQQKIEILKNKVLFKYEIEAKNLCMDDM